MAYKEGETPRSGQPQHARTLATAEQLLRYVNSGLEIDEEIHGRPISGQRCVRWVKTIAILKELEVARNPELLRQMINGGREFVEGDVSNAEAADFLGYMQTVNIQDDFQPAVTSLLSRDWGNNWEARKKLYESSLMELLSFTFQRPPPPTLLDDRTWERAANDLYAEMEACHRVRIISEHKHGTPITAREELLYRMLRTSGFMSGISFNATALSPLSRIGFVEFAQTRVGRGLSPQDLAYSDRILPNYKLSPAESEALKKIKPTPDVAEIVEKVGKNEGYERATRALDAFLKNPKTFNPDAFA